MPSAETASEAPAEGIARSYVGGLADPVGERVLLCGWIEEIQRKGDRARLKIRDRTGSVQASCAGAVVSALEGATPECAISVLGSVKLPGDGSRVEFEVEEVASLAPASSPLPLKGRANIAERLDHRYLDLRAPDKATTFAVGATVESAMREYLGQQDFLSIHAPRISGGGSESGAAVFKLPYFGGDACLVQSVQFYAQMAMCGGLDRIYDIGPVFRAENSVTNRHATEFTIIHIELAWIDSHEALMTLEEELVRHVLEVVRDRHGQDIERHFGLRVEPFTEPIPRISVAEAVEVLGEDPEVAKSGDVSARMERDLGKYVHEQFGHDFVFLTEHPKAARPFYTMLSEWEEGAPASAPTRSFDLLWRGTEITSGCQREHRYDNLHAQAETDLEPADLEHYLDQHYLEMFRFGPPSHGGFGIGVDRFLMILLAQASLRETSFVFRGPERFMP